MHIKIFKRTNFRVNIIIDSNSSIETSNWKNLIYFLSLSSSNNAMSDDAIMLHLSFLDDLFIFLYYYYYFGLEV
jgi:hypothetical protein